MKRLFAKGYLAWVICLCLFSMILISCGIPREEYQAALDQIQSLEGRIKSLEDANKSLEGLLEEKDAAIAEKDGQIQSLQAEMARIKKLKDELWEERKELNKKLWETRHKLEACQQIMSCDLEEANIDFSSNQSVSESLRAFVSENFGSVEEAEWNVIWSGTNIKDAIHYLYGTERGTPVKFAFYVNFRDKSVFLLYWNCFIKAPE